MSWRHRAGRSALGSAGFFMMRSGPGFGFGHIRGAARFPAEPGEACPRNRNGPTDRIAHQAGPLKFPLETSFGPGVSRAAHRVRGVAERPASILAPWLLQRPGCRSLSFDRDTPDDGEAYAINRRGQRGRVSYTLRGRREEGGRVSRRRSRCLKSPGCEIYLLASPGVSIARSWVTVTKRNPLPSSWSTVEGIASMVPP